jgi:hypothetical protein
MSKQVFDEFGTKESSARHRVAREKVSAWAASPDLEVQGALYLCLADTQLRARVDPELTESEFVDYALSYFDRCIQADSSGDFAHGRYEAGWDLVGIFRNVWSNFAASPVPAERIKAFLARQYLDGDVPVREFVVTAVLEHLFEVPEIESYFKDWLASDPLRSAYREAKGYAATLQSAPDKP